MVSSKQRPVKHHVKASLDKHLQYQKGTLATEEQKGRETEHPLLTARSKIPPRTHAIQIKTNPTLDLFFLTEEEQAPNQQRYIHTHPTRVGQ